MTLREKFAADGTDWTGVTGTTRLAESCLDEEIVTLGQSPELAVTRLECGDYIVDVSSSGLTLLVLEEELGESGNEDVRAVIEQNSTAACMSDSRSEEMR